jgi:hypothetical protein
VEGDEAGCLPAFGYFVEWFLLISTLKLMRIISDSHRIHHPTRLHFYRDPESIEVVIPPVILLSDDLSVDDLSTSENEALQSGHASFFSLPA